MAVHRYVARLQGASELPEDVYENVFYFDTGSPDTIEGACDGLSAAYPAHLPIGGCTGFEVRVYELAGGQPIFQKRYPTWSMPAQTGPKEIAICLSYAAVDDPDASTRRGRGRIYLGPLTAATVGIDRPNATLIDQVLDFGETVASIGFASNTTWHMYSRLDATSRKIESIWCDDSWDTQRRRGERPSARTVRDVQ